MSIKNDTEEIRLTDEQFKKIKKVLIPKKRNIFISCIKNAFYKVSKSIIDLLITILTLKNTGKWVSIITIIFVLYTFSEFLIIHKYSLEAMTLIVPYVAQIALVVFSIIAGVKGVEGVMEKLKVSGDLIDKVKNVITTNDSEKNNME